jgi:5'-AMP-activated protein kinase regulatory beta subunit
MNDKLKKPKAPVKAAASKRTAPAKKTEAVKKTVVGKKAPAKQAVAATVASQKPADKSECTPCAPRKKQVKVSIAAQPGKSIYVAGSFNDWNPTKKPLKEKDGVYSASLRLEPGLYEYKFVIDGIWTLDPDPDRDWTQNGLGTLNSLLRVE